MRTRADLARELDLLRSTAGANRARVSLAELAARSGVPRSTVHTYLSGLALPSADVLDRLVIALGGTPADQARWADAWDRVTTHEHDARHRPAATVSHLRVAPHRNDVPRQLPAAPAAFVGREHELERLDAVSAEGPVTIAGTGGMGKTWLALHWAHTRADRFPDGHLFVDLRGFSPTGDPMPATTALRGFLDALGVAPARIPIDPHAQAGLFRSLIAGKRMVVVLDNAATTEQVVPLLPGSASCAVVVTSRRRLTGLVTAHGARLVPVDALPDGEARALLTARLGAERVAAEPAAVDTLLDVCGGFALALAIIAARPRPRLAALAAGLRDAAIDVLDDEDPSASLPTVLSWSLHGLRPDERAVFVLIAIAPGPDIGLPAAASLTGRSSAVAERALRALVEASLLDRHGDRYRMHDLVRAYATTLTTDVEAPLNRVIDHYTRTAHAADLLLDPHREPLPLTPSDHAPPDYAAAMAWFDAEHACLLAAQHTAAAHRLHDSVLHLAWSLDTFHHRRGHRRDRLAVWSVAARHLDDPHALAVAERFIGRAHTVLGNHDDALARLRHALTLSDDAVHQADTHVLFARAWARKGDNGRALAHARHALALFRRIDQPVREARALTDVGWYTAHLGDHDTARDHCQAALGPFRRHRDSSGEAATRYSLGYVEHRSGHHMRSIGHYRRALALCHELGNAHAVADALAGLGHPHAALGETDRARAAWREALLMYLDQGNDTAAARMRRQLEDLDAMPSRVT